MGAPMARNLAKAGYSLRVYDVLPEAIERLADTNAQRAVSPADAARGVDCVVTMVPNGEHVEAALFGPQGVADAIGKQSLFVDMSTIPPATTDRVAKRLAESGVEMIDAPVGRSSQHAVDGKLLIMVGASAAALERLRPVLEKLGDTIVHCGTVGAGGRMKVVNNFMSVTTNATTAEALTLAEASGLDPELARKVMLGTTAGLGHLGTTYPAKVLKGDLSPGFAVDLAYKDLQLALDLGESLGLPLETGQVAKRTYEAARAAGRGQQDWTALYAHARGKLNKA